jgi:AraC family transcriptional regulator
MTTQAPYQRRVEPLALGWRSFAWSSGVFDTAHRRYTDSVAGTIRTPQHLVMVTLRGQAEKLEVSSSCGHRYTGSDRPGAVSFVPAHCERQLRLRGVASEWGSISLSPSLFDPNANDDQGVGGSLDISAFTNIDDPFIFGMVSEFARLYSVDGRLDPTYCDAMSRALARYLVGRYGQIRAQPGVVAWKLAPWRTWRIADYVDAHLAEPLRIAELAVLVGVSPGYFHRAFRTTFGKTPLEFINERRIQRALQYFHRGEASIAAIALRVGFISPSHFTRTFRQVAGINPSSYRKRLASDTHVSKTIPDR